jgi:hypothetical protein
MLVELTTLISLTVTPVLSLKVTDVTPGTKFVPVKVTTTDSPRYAETGKIEANVGAPGTAKPMALLVVVVVTVTFLLPIDVPAGIAKTAVRLVGLWTCILDTARFPALTVVAPLTKPLPVNVTVGLLGTSPNVGLIVVSLARGGFTTKSRSPAVFVVTPNGVCH